MNALEFLGNLISGGLGNLVANLISDPELSLQSILIAATIIGRLKA